jgi:hypothetical protein
LGTGLGQAVELGNSRCKPADHAEADLVISQKAFHHPVCGQSLHVDEVVDDLAFAADAKAAIDALERFDAKVDSTWAAAAVEADLRVAGGAASLKAGEIDEAEVNGLLELVDVVIDQEYPRDVRLDELDRGGRLWVCRLVQQGLHVVGQGCGRRHMTIMHD